MSRQVRKKVLKYITNELGSKDVQKMNRPQIIPPKEDVMTLAMMEIFPNVEDINHFIDTENLNVKPLNERDRNVLKCRRRDAQTRRQLYGLTPVRIVRNPWHRIEKTVNADFFSDFLAKRLNPVEIVKVDLTKEYEIIATFNLPDNLDLTKASHEYTVIINVPLLNSCNNPQNKRELVM